MDDSRSVRESIRRPTATARQFVKINCFCCDRSFYPVLLVETFVEVDLELVVHAPQTVGIKRAFDAYDASRFVTDYELVRKSTSWLGADKKG